MSGSKLLKGAFILTLAMAISKILGFIYVIPFTAMVGTTGYILFEYAYKPYVLMISVATLGVPLAISRFISKYDELKEFETTRKLFKSSMWLMAGTGVVSFSILYFSAPMIAHMLLDENATTGNAIEDVVYVIRMVSTALLVVPIMAIIRGYFQGHGAMIPTAVSQVLEQLFRIVFILVSSFAILNTYNGNIKTAVGFATFGATVGAVVAFGCLIWFLVKWKDRIKDFGDEQNPPSISLGGMYKELISYAIPFVIIGLAIPLFQLIETFTINKPLMALGYTQLEAETVNSLIALVQKLILIPVALATALGAALVPSITQAYTAKNMEDIHEQITKTFQILFWMVVPVIAMMILLSTSFFGVMFGLDNALKGGYIMAWYAPSTIVYSLFIVTAAILQGLNKDLIAIFSLFLGIMIKFATNVWVVTNLEAIGTIITTNLGFVVAIIINLWAIKKHASYSFVTIFKSTKTIAILTVQLTVFAFVAKWAFTQFFEVFSLTEYQNHIALIISVLGVSALFYLIQSFKTDILFDLLGDRYTFVRRMKKKKERLQMRKIKA